MLILAGIALAMLIPMPCVGNANPGGDSVDNANPGGDSVADQRGDAGLAWRANPHANY